MRRRGMSIAVAAAEPTFKYQGHRFRLTDVHGNVVKHILA